MTKIITYGDEDRLLPWAAERTGITRYRNDAYAIGAERDGEICGVIVFDSFTDATCEMHVASDGSAAWLNQDLLACVFAYPFIQIGYESVTSCVVADNEQAIEFCEKVGFERVGVRHKAFAGGRDVVVLEMLRENCRWIPGGNDGKE